MINFANLDNRWLVVQVQAGWEMRVARGMRRQGYEDFVPSYRQERSWSVALLKQSAFVEIEGHDSECIPTDTVELIPRLRSTNASFQEYAFS
jgi:hypothetical protein